MMPAALNALAGLVLAINGQTYDGGGRTVDYLNITGSNVTVTDLRVRESGPGINGISVWGSRSTLRRVVVERAGATGIYYFAGTGHLLTDSTIRDPVRRPGVDSWGIYSGTSGSVTVRRNVVYGSGFANYAPRGSSVIEDNHFIVPEDYRTDCAGRMTPDGPCQCAEFGIALKSGNARIRRNVIAGYRTADPVCGGSGSPGAGISVAGCAPNQTCPTSNVTIEGNTIINTHDGVYVSPRSTNIRIQANRICNSDNAVSDGFGAPSAIMGNRFSNNLVNLNLYGSRRGPVRGNWVVTDACP